MKLRLKILAWCHVVIGGLGLTAFALLLVTFGLAHDPAYDDEFSWMATGLGLSCLVYFLPAFMGGVWLLRGRPLGRAVIWLVSAGLALLVPVGTVICGVSIWVLLSTWDPAEAPSFGTIERFVQNSLRAIILMLAALFVLGVILGLGYIFRDVIDPPRKQELTPIPEMPVTRPPPAFRMPELPRGPE